MKSFLGHYTLQGTARGKVFQPVRAHARELTCFNEQLEDQKKKLDDVQKSIKLLTSEKIAALNVEVGIALNDQKKQANLMHPRHKGESIRLPGMQT